MKKPKSWPRQPAEIIVWLSLVLLVVNWVSNRYFPPKDIAELMMRMQSTLYGTQVLVVAMSVAVLMCLRPRRAKPEQQTTPVPAKLPV